MSASLDKSLDDIISSNRKPKFTKKPVGKKPNVSNKVGKKIGSSNKKPIVTFKKAQPPVKKQQSPAVDISYATKVVAQNLPKDIKQDGIRVCFIFV